MKYKNFGLFIIVSLIFIISSILTHSVEGSQIIAWEDFDRIDESGLGSNWTQAAQPRNATIIDGHAVQKNAAPYSEDSTVYYNGFSNMSKADVIRTVWYTNSTLNGDRPTLRIILQSSTGTKNWAHVAVRCQIGHQTGISCYNNTAHTQILMYSITNTVAGEYYELNITDATPSTHTVTLAVNLTSQPVTVFTGTFNNYENVAPLYYSLQWEEETDSSSLAPEWLYVDSVSFINDSGGGGSPPVSDATPPVISNVIESPLNYTFNHLFNTTLNISANITDETSLDYDSIYMNVTYNNTYVYVNGTLQNNNQSLSYDYNISDKKFTWWLDEHNLVSGTYNLDPDIFENTIHQNLTLTGQNSWLKTEFLNVRNDIEQSLFEIMDTNYTGVTSTSEYYYCNQNYTAGNPVSDDDCVLFYSRLNNDEWSHIHNDNSKHHVIPLGINTSNGKIGNVYVTSTSYILKRGTVSGDIIYYVPNTSRLTTTATSNNNGNSYTQQTYTPDSHIHQVNKDPPENVNYIICASDSSNNSACSDWYSEIIEFPVFPPSSVDITSPVNTNYNDSINIIHSGSFSVSGQSITGYKIEYAINGTTNFVNIVDNNYPNLNYTWDISSMLNNAYYIRVTVTDSLNQTSFTDSQIFNIVNELTVDQQLLTSIDDTLDEINEVFTMLQFVVLYAVLLFFGYWLTISYNYWIGLPFLLSTFLFNFQFWLTWESTYPVIAMAFTGLTFGSIFMFLFLNRKVWKKSF